MSFAVMKWAYAGILFVVLVAADLAVHLWLLRKKKQEGTKKKNNIKLGQSVCRVVTGEISDVTYDDTVGMSSVVMELPDGSMVAGFSGLSVKEIEALYVGRGVVGVPLSFLSRKEKE